MKGIANHAGPCNDQRILSIEANVQDGIWVGPGRGYGHRSAFVGFATRGFVETALSSLTTYCIRCIRIRIYIYIYDEYFCKQYF